MKSHLLLIAVLAAAPVTLFAEDAEEESPWSGKATLGYLATSGNTENSTLNTGFEVGYTVGKWAHLLQAAAITASEDEESTAGAYDLGWKSERKMSGQNFLFGRLQWRKDDFGAYYTQFSQTLGYGRRLIDNDKHELKAELGVGARQSQLQLGGKESEAIFTAGAYYKWAFSEAAEFRQSLRAEVGGLNTYSESITAVSAKLFGDLAMVASYTIKNNSDVPPLSEKTDTYTALSLEYVF
jgi:putative salt-induced outer membrane protein